ncbi:MAG: hypothetical protein KGO05_06835 [Chloroflexota bacterium]|nr:hypothetical protein [Chloroflexota bacterium]
MRMSVHMGWGKAQRFLATVVAVVALVALAGCASATSQQRAVSAPTVPATIQGRLTLRVRQAVGSAASAVDVTYQEASGAAVAVVTLTWQPAWKTDFARAQSLAKTVCYQTQAALWTSGVALSKAAVTVLGQALDDYGEIITSAYAAASLTSARASAIHWPATTADAAWSRYDDVFLRPLYGSDWMYPRPTTPPAH